MTTHLKVRVDPDEFGLPGNRHHCAIANALMLADPDLVMVRVDEDNIRFSRRSTFTRYVYATPAAAAAFIREFDRLVAAADGGGRVRKMTAKPFTLTLDDHDLIREQPRIVRNRSREIVRTAAKVYGPIGASSTSTNAPTVKGRAGRATPEPVTPTPRKRTNPVPRKRPSVRAS